MAKKVVIDAGHGGVDSGTVNNGIVEKEYALKISNYIKKRLDELGIENSMTRTTDELLDQTTRPKKVQSFYGNGSDVIVISNHLNAGGGDGAEIIYSLRNSDNLSRRIANEFESAGQNVRKYYQRRLPSNPAKDYYYLLRDTPNNETIIVEYGFTDSSGDDVSQIKNNWESLAEAVVKALAGYVGVAYTIPGENYYIVQKGDSLWSIAKKLGTSVANLKTLNNLSTNFLSIGQKLVINSQGSDNGDVYTIKNGDTLYNIAQNFGVTVNELMNYNNLSTTFLSIGQKLKIPPSVDTATYIVQSGDTLYAIASRFNTTVSNLVNLNNLSTTNLSIGQSLKIPKNTSLVTYVVVSGDNLYSIAKKYNTTVDAIKRLNNLSSNLLSVGQKLTIPN
ncbi:MAG: LysM peptidoglycan-binding domain-containing protein [Firmicutes bacterium]|nr:LysM peptidoglycan-binding domain-containing protein [Bacillota bacterium]